MFWAAVLPFQITCVVVAVGYAAFVLAAPKLKLNRGHAAALGLGLSALGFIPLCLGIDVLLSPIRFGVFEYASPAAMGDGHADRRLPPEAGEITINQYSSGFEARYTIARSDLDAWIDAEWERAGEYAAIEREEPEEPADEPTAEELDSPAGRHRQELKAKLQAHAWSRLAELGWSRPPDAVEIKGPRASNGGGSNYFYSASEGRAYQRAYYW
ncbi:hypothetical protein [Alienimonas chondri]|uniref:Uncharacterized protein n=1 Tax=Alienimonas chondri TaxID=2681879 RepID=A0ABX1VDA0_9PLAN|nr:hypothetical protein [Alienimonas chondri]NNJ26083.1 hypothetical protein [Alienimonas chondri]